MDTYYTAKTYHTSILSFPHQACWSPCCS